MKHYVWLSVQSGFGLTISELGSLSSDTDPKLIASTLMALKDIISIEASGSGTSQFMTGSVEDSSYGTFSINISAKLNLIMSYIVSTEKGSVVDNDFVNLITDLLLNLGKQLTQFGEIADLVNSGAVLPRSILIQAYLNACTVLRTQRNLDVRDRQLNESYDRIISDLFEDKETLQNIFMETLGEKWEITDDLWLESGILKNSARELLFETLSDYIVFTLANQQPDIILHSKSPRNEQYRVYQMLKEYITANVSDPTPIIKEKLEAEMKGNVKNYIKRIQVVDLHKAEAQIQKYFVRKSIIKVARDDPMTLLVKPESELVTARFLELVPELTIDHAGIFIYHAIKQHVAKESHPYIKSFYTGFVEGMADTRLTQTAMDLMIAFTQSFSPTKTLAKEIKEVPGIENTWAIDLSKFIRSKTINNLQVNSIDEAVLLSNAAGNAIVSALTNILYDNFFMNKDHVGAALSNLVNLYADYGLKIKIAHMLFLFLKILEQSVFSSNLIVPTIKDVLFSYVILNKYHLEIDEKIYEYNPKDFVFQNDKTKFELDELESLEISIFIQEKDEKIEVDLKNISYEYLLKILLDTKIYKESTIYSIYRKYENKIKKEYNAWNKEVTAKLDNIKEKIEQGLSLQHFGSFDVSPPSYISLSKLEFGEHVTDILIDTAESISKLMGELSAEMEEIKSEGLVKGELPKKADKRLDKAIKTLEKEILKIEAQMEKQFDKLFKDIDKIITGYSAGMKKIVTPDGGDILKYNFNNGPLLPTMKTLEPKLMKFIEQSDAIEPEDINQMILSITLSLYNTPPESVFDSAYNEIISGKRSKGLKKILNKVKTKRQLERALKSSGEAVSNALYAELTDLMNLLDNQFIDNNAIVTSDAGKLLLNYGRLKVNSFGKTNLITDLIKIDGVNLTRETSDWLVSLDITPNYDFSFDDPSIVTFSDSVRFMTRKIFEQNTKITFDGLAKVAAMIEDQAGERVQQAFTRLKNAIYNTDVSY
ncbi:MAG: hypothetical protein INQ03_11915 [Candidatus Heimdallarchaeota archaeon]|nr:hypothetical protein [Candidatus Heimdallarchaeota archaeon]